MFVDNSTQALFLIPTCLAAISLYQLVWVPLLASPLRKIPGPKLYAVTKWRLAYDDWKGTRTRTIHQLHAQYGPAVRIGPKEVSFDSLEALKIIYGGSGFARTEFYRQFDTYGRQTMFSMGPSKLHAERKRLLSHAYSKSSVLSSPKRVSTVQDTTRSFLEFVKARGSAGTELFTALHYFSLDSISRTLYEKEVATKALTTEEGRSVLADIFDPARRWMSWFFVHLLHYTELMLARTGLQERFIEKLGLLPQKKPTLYTAARKYAFNAALYSIKNDTGHCIASMLARCKSRANIDDLDIAAECADHLLAGIDTTANTLTFAIHALSLPENAVHQERLRQELASISALDVIHPAEADKLPFLNVVIKETLRLYAPLPATEPRVNPYQDTVIEGYTIPAGTVVGMQPYTSHRAESVYENPLEWNPERWLGDKDAVRQMEKWWWPWGKGGRMCIGLHFAMAEMTTLLATIFKHYKTSLAPGTEETVPAVISRFEILSDWDAAGQQGKKPSLHDTRISFQNVMHDV